MATPLSPSARLTATAAAVLAVALATFTPAGPWQPASVLLGWVAVVAVVLSLASGYTWGLGAGVVLLVVRTGIHGLAGDPTPGLAIATALILAVSEFGSASFEARTTPLDLATVVARTVVVASGGAVMVAIVDYAIQGPTVRGTGVHLAALGTAFALASLVLWLHQRSASRF